MVLNYDFVDYYQICSFILFILMPQDNLNGNIVQKSLGVSNAVFYVIAIEYWREIAFKHVITKSMIKSRETLRKLVLENERPLLLIHDPMTTTTHSFSWKRLSWIQYLFKYVTKPHLQEYQKAGKLIMQTIHC